MKRRLLASNLSLQSLMNQQLNVLASIYTNYPCCYSQMSMLTYLRLTSISRSSFTTTVATTITSTSAATTTTTTTTPSLPLPPPPPPSLQPQHLYSSRCYFKHIRFGNYTLAITIYQLLKQAHGHNHFHGTIKKKQNIYSITSVSGSIAYDKYISSPKYFIITM